MNRRNHPLFFSLAALAGVLVGVASCLAAQRLVPASRAQPELFAVNELHFGVDELGRPALCDQDGAAWVLVRADGAARQQLARASIQRADVIQALACPSK